jgi:hypothetical protein
MHKVLKDYLMTSTGDLLRVVASIEQMVKSQYSKYAKEIASSKHRTKFQHKLESMPFLPPGIHDVLTPPAIERIRQQDLLRQKEQRQRRGGHPCSGLFEKTNGLPCRHTLQEVMAARSTLRLNHLYDDHWRYEREQGSSVFISPRPYQSVLEPLTAQTRGAPRRSEASTRRDPSAFERRVPPSMPRFQPYHQSQGQTLAEALQQVNTSVTVSIPSPTSVADPVTTCISVSIPAPAPLAPLAPASPWSSPPVAVAVSVTMASSPVRQPPTLEEFLADVEGRRSQPVLYNCNDMMSATDFLTNTGQEGDPAELVEARNMALAKQGLFASCTPTRLGTIISETWKLSMLKGLHRLMLKMQLLSLRSHLHGGPNALQQWQLQKPGKTLVRERDDGVSRQKFSNIDNLRTVPPSHLPASNTNTKP